MAKLLVAMVILLTTLSDFSCKKDDAITGGGTESGESYGSGTVNIRLTNDNLIISGKGNWPPVGEGVIAICDTAEKAFVIVAYKQSTNSKYHAVAFIIQDQTCPK